MEPWLALGRGGVDRVHFDSEPVPTSRALCHEGNVLEERSVQLGVCHSDFPSFFLVPGATSVATTPLDTLVYTLPELLNFE